VADGAGNLEPGAVTVGVALPRRQRPHRHEATSLRHVFSASKMASCSKRGAWRGALRAGVDPDPGKGDRRLLTAQRGAEVLSEVLHS